MLSFGQNEVMKNESFGDLDSFGTVFLDRFEEVDVLLFLKDNLPGYFYINSELLW